MSNVHGFNSYKKDDPEDQSNRLYVGGASNQGGSGLSVIAGDSNDNSMENIINQARNQAANEGIGAPPEGSRIVTFYQNGFTVDNGPLRLRDDPQNRQFLDAIEKGYVPRELEGSNKNEQVHISLVDKRSEVYKPPTPPSYTAFSGEGQAMGSGSHDQSAIITKEECKEESRPQVDESLPKTTLQIRLHNGQRLRQTLNLTHTIRDIQTIITLEGAGGMPYILLAGYPPKPITDMSQTLEAAGLKGAAVTQKLA